MAATTPEPPANAGPRPCRDRRPECRQSRHGCMLSPEVAQHETDPCRRQVGGPTRSIRQRILHPSNRACGCDPDRRCRRTALARALRCRVPAQATAGPHHQNDAMAPLGSSLTTPARRTGPGVGTLHVEGALPRFIRQGGVEPAPAREQAIAIRQEGTNDPRHERTSAEVDDGYVAAAVSWVVQKVLTRLATA